MTTQKETDGGFTTDKGNPLSFHALAENLGEIALLPHLILSFDCAILINSASTKKTPKQRPSRLTSLVNYGT